MAVVLVAEDDADIRHLIVLRVRKAGHQVRAVVDSHQALAFLARQRFIRRLEPALSPAAWMLGAGCCRRLSWAA